MAASFLSLSYASATWTGVRWNLDCIGSDRSCCAPGGIWIWRTGRRNALFGVEIVPREKGDSRIWPGPLVGSSDGLTSEWTVSEDGVEDREDVPEDDDDDDDDVAEEGVDTKDGLGLSGPCEFWAYGIRIDLLLLLLEMSLL
jgi:hypothetical protein